MKQLIILLLIIILGIIGYGQYSKYKRYNSPNVDYTTEKKLDIKYHNQETVINYYKAKEALNSFVMLQWTANDIDVRTPKDDDNETKHAVGLYAEKLAVVKFYEAKLEKSAILKEDGISNKEIKFLEETGTDLKEYQHSLETKKIISMFDDTQKLSYGQTSALIFEVQKKLVQNGFDLKIDGIYKIETRTAIKGFEEKNNLYADGYLDVLTLDALFE
ncbi:peptidoglycan-binding domain-containing protein [uncultured Polaribacter sp.]|uniref:peptidoglycan-binding domain-containing protein n=1 Tax=uncultured Polaribacter sp. TaxID=174711 RepID=UPI002614893D|nr:peptidoglycan-binding domain-containing protein [uncultured Polaribacter sp.]